MAEEEEKKSKFLYYQDKNRDGLIDVCDEFVDVEETTACLACSPNPNALVDDWKTKTIEEPFLNEKTCEYQITVVTKHTTTIGETQLEAYLNDDLTVEEADEAIIERFDEYVEDAIRSLLEVYDKDDSDASIAAIKEVIDYTKYDLDPRPFSRLKLLYSVPFDDLAAIEDADPEDEDAEEEEESSGATVTYKANDLKPLLIRVRKGLNLYNRYLKVYRAVEGGNLYYNESNGVFPLELYGDAGFLPTSLLAKTLIELDKFLVQKGYNWPAVGGLRGAFNDRVTKAEFKFNKEFKLTRLKIWTEECGEKSITFIKKLKPLLTKSAWKDPTAMAYFARLEDMDKDLQAREPKPWLEFVKEHTYPAIYDTTNPITANTDPENSVGSCIADALAEEGKQLGQDILDDVFGIGDAIASAFHANLCRASLGEVLDDEQSSGILYGPNATGVVGKDKKGTLKDLYAIAQEQAYKEVDQEGSAFELMCVALLSLSAGSRLPGAVGTGVAGAGIDAAFEAGKKQGSSGSNIDALWSGGFDKIKLCGLFDLLMNAIECLMGGLSLEDALASMLKSAFQSMGIEYFGDLFVGLPPDKQYELDQLVKKKIESGDVFKEGTSGQQISDTIEGKLEWTKPWEQEELVEEEKENKTESFGGGMSAGEMQESSEVTHKTLTEQIDIGSASNQSQLSPNVVMEAYILALLEVYQDNLLDLLDQLNKFPGAPIIAKIIALLDCPRPPLFNPNFMDFIKDFEIPWCGNIHDLTFPRLENPFGWLPEIKDIMKYIFWAIRLILQQLIIKIIMKLIVKICDLLGNALCKALEVVGDLAASLPAVATGRTTFSDVIRDSICGEDADQEQIDNTIVDMFESLGAGGAALADQEQVLSMAEDIASATTQSELMNALLGDPSNDFLNIVETIINYEYPSFQAALPNKEKMGNFFKNMGNLMPASFKDQMKDVASEIPPNEMIPVNPSLCATTEQLDNFKELRCELLSGKATQEQCDKMFDDLQSDMLNDLDDLGSILQGGIPNYIAANMPPLVSDPGCDNGLIPFDSEEQKAAVSAALGGDMEQLKIAFSFDMLGNGPGRKKWGLINMILSDTMGMPLTAHMRKTFSRRRWVDFYVDSSEWEAGDTTGLLDGNVAMLARQKGAYPEKVAEHLQEQLTALNTDFVSSNDTLEDKSFSKSFEDLNITRFGKNVDLLSLPDFGYNFTTTVDYENEKIKFTQKARKKTADVTLSFQDAAKGDEAQDYSFGFDMEFFLSDIEENIEGVNVNRPDDSARVKITNKYNAAANLDYSTLEFMNKDEREALEKAAEEAGIIYDRKFEFLSVDDTLDGIDLSDYTDFVSTFSSKSNNMPQIVLLTEILNNNGASVNVSDMKSFHDEFMSSVLATMVADVAANDAAFTYGAVFDGLTKEDVDYVTEEGTPYFEAENDDGDNLSNDDMVLGISYMQYNDPDNNRVFYLDPAQYGGSYMNPPLYIAPLANEGWLGFVDVMFPEISPCKPQRTDLIDFEDIQSKIDEVYPSLPEDERLKSDPDCIVEKPYERILERASVAAIEGLITAGIRMFVSVHFVKAIATFTKFYPKFTETYSSLFAQYIVEDMEKHFKSAQKAGWEFFNPFKDSEFWYGFLEQSVQTYARRIDSEGITPPQSVYNALQTLAKTVDRYDYPYREDLKEAKGLDEVSRLKTLKNYRSNRNLEAVQETEELAKLVLKELVNEQLNYMGEKFVDNLKIVDMKPDVFNLDYYVLENLTQGSSLELAEEIKEEIVSLPTEDSEQTEELYTGGTEFSDTETGEMYTGYYHVTTDDDGDTVYMAGEFHVEEDHVLLRPVADQVTVPIGNVDDYSGGSGASSSTTQPFLIEKYISINGSKYSSAAAISTIKSNDNSLLISEVYPGTLEHVVDAGGKVVGLTGELGVRYGLEFSIVANGTAYPVTTVEVDALDLTIGETPPFEGDSKLLLCLVNMLVNDDAYKLVAQYIFPMKKMTALVAIYNSEGFLPSIGETTVEVGEAFGKGTTLDSKPGMQVTVDSDTGIATSSGAQPGWANIKDRSKRFTPFVLTWDEWDQVLLRKSKSRLKKLFKTHYNSRNFDPGDAASDKPGKIILNSLRESFKFSPGMNLLPWWKRRMLRSNPFNSKGELCEKED